MSAAALQPSLSLSLNISQQVPVPSLTPPPTPPSIEERLAEKTSFKPEDLASFRNEQPELTAYDLIAQCKNVTLIHLKDIPLDETLAKTIQSCCKKLKYFTLENHGPLSSVLSVTHLKLINCKTFTATPKELPQLQVLKIKGEMNSHWELKDFTKLIDLEIYESDTLNVDCLWTTSLQLFTLQQCPRITSLAKMQLQHLRSIHLVACENLVTLASFEKITAFTMDCCHRVNKLGLKECKPLEKLALTSNHGLGKICLPGERKADYVITDNPHLNIMWMGIPKA